MCTVTYIGQPGGQFILTSNRDENAARSPQHLTSAGQDGVQLVFPRDTAAGGTWIATSNDRRTVCLLNGAFEKHTRRSSYKRSRGLMVLDFFRFANAHDFFEKYDFDGMEPFTLVVVDGASLFELRWDEQRPHVRPLDAAAGRYIWSSATLYPAEVRERREGWFREWLSGRQDFSAETIANFHKTGGAGDVWNGFLMNRLNLVQTVSITQVIGEQDHTSLIYNDLLRETVKTEELKMKSLGICE